MKRLSISLPDDTYEALRVMAFEQRTSVAGVVRVLVEQGTKKKGARKT